MQTSQLQIWDMWIHERYHQQESVDPDLHSQRVDRDLNLSSLSLQDTGRGGVTLQEGCNHCLHDWTSCRPAAPGRDVVPEGAESLS